MIKHHLYVNNTEIFVKDPHGGYSGTFYLHYKDADGDDNPDPNEERRGVYFALCLPQMPDPRITTIGMLYFYKPNIYRTSFLEKDTIR